MIKFKRNEETNSREFEERTSVLRMEIELNFLGLNRKNKLVNGDFITRQKKGKDSNFSGFKSSRWCSRNMGIESDLVRLGNYEGPECSRPKYSVLQKESSRHKILYNENE